MGDVLGFPTAQAQGQAYLEQQLRSMLEAHGADDELINFAIDQLTTIYQRVSHRENYRMTVPVPENLSQQDQDKLCTDVESQLQALRAENHGLILQLVAELVMAQVSLFQSRRSR